MKAVECARQSWLVRNLAWRKYHDISGYIVVFYAPRGAGAQEWRPRIFENGENLGRGSGKSCMWRPAQKRRNQYQLSARWLVKIVHRAHIYRRRRAPAPIAATRSIKHHRERPTAEMAANHICADTGETRHAPCIRAPLKSSCHRRAEREIAGCRRASVAWPCRSCQCSAGFAYRRRHLSAIGAQRRESPWRPSRVAEA